MKGETVSIGLPFPRAWLSQRRGAPARISVARTAGIIQIIHVFVGLLGVDGPHDSVDSVYVLERQRQGQINTNGRVRGS